MERPADSLDPGRPAFCDRWACSFHCALSGTWSCPCHAQVLLPQSSVQGTQTNVNIQSKTPEGWKVLVRDPGANAAGGVELLCAETTWGKLWAADLRVSGEQPHFIFHEPRARKFPTGM